MWISFFFSFQVTPREATKISVSVYCVVWLKSVDQQTFIPSVQHGTFCSWIIFIIIWEKYTEHVLRKRKYLPNVGVCVMINRWKVKLLMEMQTESQCLVLVVVLSVAMWLSPGGWYICLSLLVCYFTHWLFGSTRACFCRSVVFLLF